MYAGTDGRLESIIPKLDFAPLYVNTRWWRRALRAQGMGSEDEGLSSDGERGGDERYDDYFDGIGAEDAMGDMGDGEFGGGPWSGEGPYAYGGGGY